MRWVSAVCLLALPVAMAGQMLDGLGIPTAKGKSYVVYDAEQQDVTAGKPGVLELRFRVLDGFHVNSHKPKSDMLIPTEVSLQPAAGVKVGSVEYPAGTAYTLSADPDSQGTKLDVYTGEFTVKVPLTAVAGEHTLTGALRYQACDRAACYPPKSLPVEVIFRAK